MKEPATRLDMSRVKVIAAGGAGTPSGASKILSGARQKGSETGATGSINKATSLSAHAPDTDSGDPILTSAAGAAKEMEHGQHQQNANCIAREPRATRLGCTGKIQWTTGADFDSRRF